MERYNYGNCVLQVPIKPEAQSLLLRTGCVATTVTNTIVTDMPLIYLLEEFALFTSLLYIVFAGSKPSVF